MNVIVTWMYCSPINESILHAQIGKESGTQRTQDYYWRCVFLLFESSARLNRNARHILFVNKSPPRTIDGISLDKLSSQYNIEVIKLQSITKSPSDYYHAWNTQFIVLDVLDQLKEEVGGSDNIFILDSDIIFNEAISNELMNDIESHKALLYSIDYSRNHDINGLTRVELLEISKEMNSGFPVDDFVYSGGELICCRGSEISIIADMGRKAYLTSLERHREGRAKFNEEAHLLSYVYHTLGYQPYTANKYVKRIWTDRSAYCNIDGSECDLVMWHLPAEKKAGFLKVFRSFREVDSTLKLTAKNFARSYGIEESISSKLLRYLKTCARGANRLLHRLTRRRA